MQMLNTIYMPLILLSMIFLHIVDDFYLQGILAQMKQKKYWEEYPKKYHDDWKIALMLHAFSWSFCIHLPIILHILYYDGYYSPVFLMISFVLNWFIHLVVDNLKANKFVINLIEDQTIHIIQIILTWIAYIIFY